MTMELEASSVEPTRTELGDGAWYQCEPGWLDGPAASEIERGLLSELDWQQREIVLFGRRILQPRLIAWAGERPYRYSGQTLEARPFGGALECLRRAVLERTQISCNHALVNRYRDGMDSMGWHSDAEPELGPNPVVVSVSFGGARRFVLRHRQDRRKRPIELWLGHGCLLIMGGRFQHTHRHALPRDPRISAERINVTFRKLVSDPL
jgi:alkylated DNA repair dioxygenase AlkB